MWGEKVLSRKFNGNNRKVEKMFIEPGKNHLSNDNDPYVESTPEKILDYLNS